MSHPQFVTPTASGPVTVSVDCPRCGHANRVTLTAGPRAVLVACDVDEGGCDGQFALRVHLGASAEAIPVLFGKDTP